MFEIILLVLVVAIFVAFWQLLPYLGIAWITKVVLDFIRGSKRN